MKKILGILCVALAVMSACKPTEANYRQAYNAAVAGRTSADADSTIYGGARRMMKERTAVIAGDTVAAKSQWVAAAKDGGGTNESIKKYCVVAGQFKQLFNAKSMRDRLVGMGYPGAFVVQDREPYYYVVALSSSDAAEAAKCLDRLRGESQLALKAPLPYLLIPSQFK